MSKLTKNEQNAHDKKNHLKLNIFSLTKNVIMMIKNKNFIKKNDFKITTFSSFSILEYVSI